MRPEYWFRELILFRIGQTGINFNAHTSIKRPYDVRPNDRWIFDLIGTQGIGKGTYENFVEAGSPNIIAGTLKVVDP